MSATRPDPDALLARVKREEEASGRGKLKLFFGASAGVGKTCAMLSEARAAKSRGVDVVIGVVETHGRSETAQLAEGFERLAMRQVQHKGATIEEFDLDAALARKPGLILVDELAHSNAPDSRHPKRWQDVEELLAAGIDVHATLNVQHLESLNDVVGQVTGVRVWETLPDKVFDSADEVELVDIPADELLDRLEQGKVYLPEQAKRAAENFFRKGNLIALRELALRRTAARVDAQMRDYRDEQGISETWPVAERLLVAIGPGGEGEHLVRAARRLAASLGAEWTALYVETPPLLRLPESERDRILGTLRLAEELGGKSVVVGGGDIAAEVLGFAHSQNATRIVIGRPKRRGWRRWIVGSTADRIVAGAADLEVELVGAEMKPGTLAAGLIARSRAALAVERAPKRRWKGYLFGAAIPAAITVVGAAMHGTFDVTNIVMVYLLGVVVVAVTQGRGPSIVASVLSVAAFDFFFVLPYLTFAVSDTQYIITFTVMLIVGLVISTLAARLRLQARIAGYREQRTSALYEMSRTLAAAANRAALVRIAVKHLSEVFESQVVVLLPDDAGRIRQPREESIAGSLHGADAGIAQWVFDHRQPAGLGTGTLAGSDTLFVPLVAGDSAIGVLALLPANPRRVFVPEQRRLLEAFAAQIALALERVQVAESSRAAQFAAATEATRNALLASISHDLRTPLATIVGASSTLALSPPGAGDDARRELAQTIAEEAARMSEVMSKVLDLARLQAGGMRLDAGWHSVEEVVGAALSRIAGPLSSHRVSTRLDPRAPLARFDAVLVEQVLINLLENAVKYAGRGAAIEVASELCGSDLLLSVADDGPGLQSGDEDRVFEKFHRGATESAAGGAGLGLAICRAVVEAHGGRIWAENIPAGGVIFRFTLPQSGDPPRVEPEMEQ